MSGLDALLRWSPLQLASATSTSDRLAVLAFHGVDDPEQFSTLMDYVVRKRRPISIDELDRALTGGTKLPDKPVLITFDDGHRSVYRDGLPILADRGLPAIAFVVAGLISTHEDFWWSRTVTFLDGGGTSDELAGLDAAGVVRRLKQVPNEERLRTIARLEETSTLPAASVPQLEVHELRELESAGVAIGNHTWSHPCLNRCDPGTVRAEVEDADRRLREAMGHEIRWFAYPNGDWDAGAESTLRDLGYRGAFLFDHRLSTVSEAMRLSRLRVNSDTGLDRFALILSGLHPTLHRARGRT